MNSETEEVHINFRYLKDRNESSYGWENVRFKLFPVEVIFIVYIFVVMFYTQIYKQYFFQRLAEDAIAANDSYLFNDTYTQNHSVCLKQKDIVPFTGNATFELIQANSNDLNMYCDIISLGTSGIVALIYGPLSDIIGRKPIMLSVFCGLLFAAIVQAVTVAYRLNLYYFLLSVGFYGLGGAYATMTGVSFAAASDVTPTKWLTLRMGIVESCVALGTIFSNIAGYYWFQKNGCNFLPPAILMIAVVVFGLLYILVFPEPLRKCNTATDEVRINGFRKLVNGGKLFLFPKYIGFSNWWRIWIITSMICLQSLCEIGSGEIINYFLHNKPLEWSYYFIGTYGIVTEAVHALLLLVVLPVLLTIRIPNAVLILIAVLFAIGCNILIASIQTTWEMFIVGGLLRMRDIGFPVMRAMLSLLVGPCNYGSVLTITSSMEMTASTGATILFNKVYHPEASVDGHEVKAGTIFWITAAIWTLNIPFILCLFCCRKLNKRVKPIQLADEKALLSSENEN